MGGDFLSHRIVVVVEVAVQLKIINVFFVVSSAQCLIQVCKRFTGDPKRKIDEVLWVGRSVGIGLVSSQVWMIFMFPIFFCESWWKEYMLGFAVLCIPDATGNR